MRGGKSPREREQPRLAPKPCEEQARFMFGKRMNGSCMVPNDQINRLSLIWDQVGGGRAIYRPRVRQEPGELWSLQPVCRGPAV